MLKLERKVQNNGYFKSSYWQHEVGNKDPSSRKLPGIRNTNTTKNVGKDLTMSRRSVGDKKL